MTTNRNPCQPNVVPSSLCRRPPINWRKTYVVLIAVFTGVLACAQPACAWGPWTHALVAERTLAILTPSHPNLIATQNAWWLAAWATDLIEASTDKRGPKNLVPHGMSGNRFVQAFERAWHVHQRLDVDFQAFTTGHHLEPLPADNRENVVWGLLIDAQLSTIAYEAAFKQARLVLQALHSPECALINRVLCQYLEITPEQLVHIASQRYWRLSQGPDAQINERARGLGLPVSAPWLRGPQARELTGEMGPWVATLTNHAASAYMQSFEPRRKAATNTRNRLLGQAPRARVTWRS